MPRMRPRNEDEYFTARDAIVAEFADWAADRNVDAGEVQLLLDYKWGYVDGRLGEWRAPVVEEFLHDWYPRKVVASPDIAPEVTTALSAFFEFLAEQDLMDRHSAPVPKLIAALVEHESCLAKGLDLPEMFGPSKAIATAMAADGVDMADEPAVQAWIEAFNAGPIERRDAILGWDEPPTPPPPPELTSRPSPPEDDVRTTAAAAPILDLFSRFAQYVEDGRNLTQTGNLRLADARELIEILETGEIMDTTIGDRTFKRQSAAHLRRLDLIFNWAKRVRVLRVARGRLYATKTWPKLKREPVAALGRAVDLVLANGLLEAWQGWWGKEAESNVVDGTVPLMLARLYEAEEPEPYDEILDALVWTAERLMEFPEYWTPDIMRNSLSWDLDGVVEILGMAGVTVRREAELEENEYGPSRPRGGTLELTPFGVDLVQRWLPTVGWIVPVLPRFEVTADATPEDITHALSDMLHAGGPVAMLDAFTSLGNDAMQQVLIDRIWRVGDDGTGEVLNAIGRHHLVKPVAKAARKAVLKHQSWRAGR